jgi:hypothetical protein
MDCAIDSAAAKECRVRSVHDAIDIQRCDVALDDFDFG